MDLSEILFHHGENRQEYYNAVSPPIIQTSNFCFARVQDMRAALQDEYANSIYSRGANPTVKILRQKLAALEGTDDALVLASGCAAISTTLLSLLNAGDHMVCVDKPYSWVSYICKNVLPRFSISVTFVGADSPENYQDAINPATKLFYLESPNTFTFEVLDIERIAQIAKKHGILTVIDNSYASPLFQKPHLLGIDLVLHSASKYLSGHSDVVAGVIAGSHTLIQRIYHSGFLAFGGIIAPNDAWLIIRGLRTLELRLEKSSKNGSFVLNWLKDNPLISKIYYPFLPSNQTYALAQKQMLACSGMFSIALNVKDPNQVYVFCNTLKRFLLAVSWGGFESLVMPAIAFYNFDDPASNSIDWRIVRLYIGLEDPQVLVDDLNQAFMAIHCEM
jgi:cystathionine beta-lyase/cystathionine gamma-synthase